MATRRTKVMLGNMALLLAPIGALKLAAMWMGPGPQSASADAAAPQSQTTSMPLPGAATVDTTVRAQREKAASYVLGMHATGFGPTPFYYEIQAAPQVTPTVDPVIDGAPAFVVQVIMSSNDDTKALINGKVYRVGDEFRDGWIIAEIDGFARTVTIADPQTSRSVTQSVRLPGEN